MSGDRFFVQLKAHGRVDDSGRTVIGVERSTKRIIAPHDAPLSLVVAILDEWRASWTYSTPEAAERDFARLRTFAENLVAD
jgi:hypothetical protein